MANIPNVIKDFRGVQSYPVKGSASNIEVGDLVFFDSRFQGQTGQNTLQPASAGSTGASAADGRYQFANLFAGVSRQRHDVNTFDKANFGISVDCEIEMLIANSTGTQTAANAEIDVGAKVGAAVDANFNGVDGLVQVDGLHSVTIADNQAIGRLSRRILSGDRTARIHIVGTFVMTQSGI